VRHSKTFPWVKLLVIVTVGVLAIVGVVSFSTRPDVLFDQSTSTPEPTSTAFERLAQKVFNFGKKMLATYQDVSESARSPAWYIEHCDYVELDPQDLSPDVPDGIYVNCDESSTKSPGALEQFENIWGAAIEPTVPNPDTWEHWFPTVPKPDKKKKDLSDRFNGKTLDPTRIIPGEPARHWEVIPARKLKGSVIY